MRILLVEDQPDKREQIKDFIRQELSNDLEIAERESLRGALKEVRENSNYDLILLDMTMPDFDPSEDNASDSSPESFAGREFLEHMRLRKINIPVIVITQYSFFEGGVTLEKLSEQFAKDFAGNYLGSVYFNSAIDSWKKELLVLLEKFL